MTILWLAITATGSFSAGYILRGILAVMYQRKIPADPGKYSQPEFSVTPMKRSGQQAQQGFDKI